jgi:hypothetical protein
MGFFDRFARLSVSGSVAFYHGNDLIQFLDGLSDGYFVLVVHIILSPLLLASLSLLFRQGLPSYRYRQVALE